MNRRIDNIERPKQANKGWILFFLIPLIGGGLFYYYSSSVQSTVAATEEMINALEDELKVSRMNRNNAVSKIEEYVSTIEAQKKYVFEQERIIEEHLDKIISLENTSKNNSIDLEDKLKLELELQEKVITITNLENQIRSLNNELSVAKSNQNTTLSLTSSNNSNPIIAEINQNPDPEKQSLSLKKLEDQQISIPVLVKSIPPKYPARAIQRNLSGEVELVFDIDQFGKPLNIRILYSSSRLFEDSAINAIEKAVYSRP